MIGQLGPVTSDGKPIFLPQLFPGDVIPLFLGCADDPITGIRFGGTRFAVATSLAEDVVVEWQFIEWVYLAGGNVWATGQDVNDWISYEMSAPATVGTSNPGAGGFNKVTVAAGVNLYVPAVNGNWDLNLTEKLNANVGFTKVVPVPSEDVEGNGTGFFDWSADTEVVTLNIEQKGHFNLFDVEIKLAKHVQKVPLLGGHVDFTVPATKPKRILAHWKNKAIIHNDSAKLLKVAWYQYGARKKAT